MALQKVASVSEVPPGTVTEVMYDDQPVAICNVDGEVRAISGVCPHSGGPLGQGALHDELIVCPWHMWPFDSKTGACGFNDRLRVPVYAVRVEGEDVLVDLPDA